MPSLPLTIWHERRHSGFRRRIMTTPQRGPTEPLHSAVARWVNYTKRFRLAIIGAAAGAAAVVVSCPTAPTAAGRANAPHFGVHPSLAQARCSFRRPSRIKEPRSGIEEDMENAGRSLDKLRFKLDVMESRRDDPHR